MSHFCSFLASINAGKLGDVSMHHGSQVFNKYHREKRVKCTTHVMIGRHCTREEKIGKGGDKQESRGDEKAQPPGTDPTRITLVQLLFSSCKNGNQCIYGASPGLNTRLSDVITQTNSVHIHIELQDHRAQQVANSWPKYRYWKKDGWNKGSGGYTLCKMKWNLKTLKTFQQDVQITFTNVKCGVSRSSKIIYVGQPKRLNGHRTNPKQELSTGHEWPEVMIFSQMPGLLLVTAWVTHIYMRVAKVPVVCLIARGQKSNTSTGSY